ncbi:hypothetical protein JX265_011890 [Neoarthrinium moseri]|uniref:Ecp2 effector protein-like domain-containing protein n=1 Tax=Neoarthrinium moseri TaxID=1658444 RepID=A0A9Q0AK79_9PEZI|nr:uncharacterized protein JN550_013561 [Neoarthrinium moseri]KAI1846431.1 hypothetical protein JX266_007636 [Neoarthrinium moseri]KAI1855993.1 hypothetical protein JX265_011890 [Neoarthrinium moseri]KAI1856925.1 hypothetical protein JN550_013561 [Neoarthrinium moseri]
MRLLQLSSFAILVSQVAGSKWLDGEQYTNKCGGTTWDVQVSDGSPSAADCSAIVKYMRQRTGGYFLNGLKDDIWNTLKSEGGCGFGLKPKSRGSFYMGGDDVADLIQDSIAQFEKDGKVGVTGVTQCGDETVQWAIYGVPPSPISDVDV